MGKGCGCFPFPSKKKVSIVVRKTDDIPNPERDVPVAIHTEIPDQKQEIFIQKQENKKKLRIFIVFYSMYGHVEILAKRIKTGVESIDGVEGILFRVPETMPLEVLEQMKVPNRDEDIPVVAVEELMEADGFLFGFPTRYGSMAAQMKAFFDSTGELWKEQRLAGIPAGFFVSTGTQGGGQETTAWTAITQLAHHGMIYVPIGYTFGSGMFEMDSIRGGSPYGAGVFSGDGTRKPSKTEMELAEHHGKYMATIVKKFSHPI